jgi:hypothetical protein
MRHVSVWINLRGRGASTLLLLLCLLPINAFAQRATARIVGTVSDKSGAVIPGAALTAVNEGTQLTATATADQQGYYVFPALQPGNYTVSVSHAGFKKLENRGIGLDADRVVKVDLELEVGSLNQSLEVTSTPPLINTENVAMTAGVDKKQIRDLPINSSNGRQILDFMLLGAGTTSTGSPYGNNNYSINGSPQNTQIAMVDGTQISLPGANFWYLIRPAVSEVSEIKVQSGSFAPDTAGLSSINISTISGSNKFHGSAFYFFSNQNLSARNFFQGNVAQFNTREFGGTITGPVIKNRTFFSFSYDRFNRSNPQSPITTVPTSALRSGNFQGVASVYDPNSTVANPNGSGYTRALFPNNQIPTSRMDKVSLNMMSYWPQQNLSGTVNNFNPQLIAGTDNMSYLPNVSLKIDQKINDKNHLFGRFQRIWGGYRAEQVFPGPADYTGQTVSSPAEIVTLGDTHTFNSNMVNEFRFGYVHSSSSEMTAGANQNLASKVGLQGVSPLEFPVVSIGGALSMYLGPRDQDSASLTQSYQWNDSVTIVHGAQIIKFGGNFVQELYNTYSSGRPSGQFTFAGIFTNNPSISSAGIGFADFLLGLPSATSVNGSNQAFIYEKPDMGLFLQDDIKLRPNLTVNLAVRYDLQWGVAEQNNRMSTFSPTTTNPVTNTPGALIFAGLNAPHRFSNPDKGNISPRVGVAYSVDRKTVIRAGYAINFYPNPMSWQTGSKLGYVPSLTLTTTDQITPLVQLSAGIPSIPAPQLNGAIGNGNGVQWIPGNNRSLALYEGTLSIQRELPGKLFLEAAYVNTRGVHLWFPRDINQVPANMLGPGNTQLLRPYPQYQGVTANFNDGSSKYNAFQTTLSRRLSDQFTFSANYTFSKAMDNSSYDYGGGGDPYQNLNNLKAEWAVSSHDRPQVFNATLNFEVPRLGHGFVGRYLLKGWEGSVVEHAQSGEPLNATTSINQSGALSGVLRPNCIADPSLSDASITGWFNTSAFTLPAPYSFGSCGRNVIRGPGFVQTDFALHKNTYFRTPLNENTKVEFRAEFYNLLNHPNWNNPNTSIGSAAAGTITSAANPRQITLGFLFEF